MILFDTNVISELVRQTPDPVVLAYVQTVTPEVIFTAAVCDAMIAALTRAYGAVLATRNFGDFVGCDTAAINPSLTRLV